MAKKGRVFHVQSVATGSDGRKLYFVSYYGSSIAFPADACEELSCESKDSACVRREVLQKGTEAKR